MTVTVYSMKISEADYQKLISNSVLEKSMAFNTAVYAAVYAMSTVFSFRFPEELINPAIPVTLGIMSLTRAAELLLTAYGPHEFIAQVTKDGQALVWNNERIIFTHLKEHANKASGILEPLNLVTSVVTLPLWLYKKQFDQKREVFLCKRDDYDEGSLCLTLESARGMVALEESLRELAHTRALLN
jgi:hypothetical protein